jgi:hypothetical protein
MIATLWRYPIATVAAMITPLQAPVIVTGNPINPVSRPAATEVQSGSTGFSKVTFVEEALG